MRQRNFVRTLLVLCGITLPLNPVLAQVPMFTNVTVATGLDCTAPCAGQPAYTPQPGDHHAPSGAWVDVNNDFYMDLYLVDGDPQGAGYTNRLYLNVDDGNGNRVFNWWAFSQGALPAQQWAYAGDQGDAVGAIAADYDNDGDQDIYVVNFDSPNRLYENLFMQIGLPLFVDVSHATDPTPMVNDHEFGVAFAVFGGEILDNSLTAAWADVDRDGDLDLYVGNHNGWIGAPMEGPTLNTANFTALPGRRDVLYLSNVAQGSKTFTTDFTMTNSVDGYVAPPPGGGSQTAYQHFSSTNGVLFADFDNDRWPDLLVPNKVGGTPTANTDFDMLYINQQQTTGTWNGYQTVTYTLPTPFGNQSAAAMGVDVADFDNDGDMDIYMTDGDNSMGGGSNDLWINQKAPNNPLDFVHSPMLPARFSWGAQFLDVDNDGWQDLHVATHLNRTDFLYWQNPPGTFNNIAAQAGVAQSKNSRGDLSADYDRDGQVDLLVITAPTRTSVNPQIWTPAPPTLYRNISATQFPQNGYLHLRLLGDPNAAGPFKSSLDAIGARVLVTADLNNNSQIDPGETQYKEVVSGSSNAASTSSLVLEYGIGLAPNATVQVQWPSGAVSNFNNVGRNQCAIVLELNGQILPNIC